MRILTLLCWHAERADPEVLRRAIKALRNRRIYIDRVIYLMQAESKSSGLKTVEQATVEPNVLPLDDPTKHAEIYRLIKQRVLPRSRTEDGDLHINVSPGTPAMHAVWLVLHAGGVFPEGTRLWSSQYNPETKRSKIDPVKFEITTYLAEIWRLQRAEPGRAIYKQDTASPERRAALERLARYAKVSGALLLILGERGIGKSWESVVSAKPGWSKPTRLPSRNEISWSRWHAVAWTPRSLKACSSGIVKEPSPERPRIAAGCLQKLTAASFFSTRCRISRRACSASSSACSKTGNVDTVRLEVTKRRL